MIEEEFKDIVNALPKPKIKIVNDYLVADGYTLGPVDSPSSWAKASVLMAI